jgi:hypothetical protein
MRMMRKFSLINFVAFQVSWFLCASYQKNAIPIVMILICIHFLLSPKKSDDLKVLPIALVGIVIDQLLIILHIIEIPQGTTSSVIIPVWLALLWCVFSWCFNHSLQWVCNLSLSKISIIGAIFGTLSYYAALKIGVFNSLLSPPYFICIMAIIWALLLPFFIRIYALFIKPKSDISEEY